MEQEQDPPEYGVPEQDVPVASSTEEALPEPSSGLPQRTRVALALAAVLLVLPVVYLLASRRAVTPVQSMQQPAGATDVRSLETLVQASPTVANRINLSLAYINGGAAARAVPILLSVVAEDKTNVVAWNNLCVAHTMQREYAAAISECNNALLISPGFQLAQNNLKWAQDENNKSLGGPAAGSRDAAFYVNDGMKQLNLGFYDQAIDSWKHALELDPSSALAANNIGTAYMMKKQPEEALVWFNKALALNPTLQLAKNNLAWAQQVLAKGR